MTAGDRLSRIQGKAIPALLTCRTIEEAATAAGVGEKTLRRWLGSEPFAKLKGLAEWSQGHSGDGTQYRGDTPRTSRSRTSPHARSPPRHTPR